MKLLLCTDLDRTLLPNGASEESAAARPVFRQLSARPEITLVYVTGRDSLLVQQAIQQFQLPLPAFVIADVGSTIYQPKAGKWQQWKAWEEKISVDWQGKTHADLEQLLIPFTELKLQENSKQNTHKLSYYISLPMDYNALINDIQQTFSEQQIHVNIIWSIDDLTGFGLLDILPAGAGKRQAIEFLMQQLNYSLNETVFSGDSGNDISVMESPIKSVLVANASEDIRRQAIQQASKNHQANSLYVAEGSLPGMNGNYSAGIIEGVLHFVPEAAKWVGLKK